MDVAAAVLAEVVLKLQNYKFRCNVVIVVKKSDKIDPMCGMKGAIKAHGHYFCSEHCIRKYERQHRIKKGLYCPECAKASGQHAVQLEDKIIFKIYERERAVFSVQI